MIYHLYTVIDTKNTFLTKKNKFKLFPYKTNMKYLPCGIYYTEIYELKKIVRTYKNM
jgi:hypothetical protein